VLTLFYTFFLLGELKQQCQEVTNRFELETRLWREEKDQANRTIRDLNSKIGQVQVNRTIRDLNSKRVQVQVNRTILDLNSKIV
jgi:hypothetical protein